MVQWLLKRSPLDRPYPPSSDGLLKWLYALKILLQGLRNRALSLLGGLDCAASVYAGMLAWGRRSGKPLIASETSVEYGRRLSGCFPKNTAEINMIIEAFNREIYGEIPTQGPVLRRISSALVRMRSPRHWPSRLRGWFIRHEISTNNFIKL